MRTLNEATLKELEELNDNGIEFTVENGEITDFSEVNECED